MKAVFPTPTFDPKKSMDARMQSVTSFEGLLTLCEQLLGLFDTASKMLKHPVHLVPGNEYAVYTPSGDVAEFIFDQTSLWMEMLMEVTTNLVPKNAEELRMKAQIILMNEAYLKTPVDEIADQFARITKGLKGFDSVN